MFEPDFQWCFDGDAGDWLGLPPIDLIATCKAMGLPELIFSYSKLVSRKNQSLISCYILNSIISNQYVG